MAVVGSLRFLLAPAPLLDAEQLSTAELSQVQAQGVTRAFALRIVVTHDLGGRLQRVCDAVTPCFEPQRLWLGVYEPIRNQPDQWRPCDRFPLSEARNDSCWFYPTHDGHYLSWQRELKVSLEPGRIAEPAAASEGEGYSRGAIALLWSLLADDTGLTCVGLTHAGLRIDWPLLHRQWSPEASWCSFSVDSSRQRPLIVDHRRQVTATSG